MLIGVNYSETEKEKMLDKSDYIARTAMQYIAFFATIAALMLVFQVINFQSQTTFDERIDQQAYRKSDDFNQKIAEKIQETEKGFYLQKQNILNLSDNPELRQNSLSAIEDFLKSMNGVVDSMVVQSLKGSITLVYDKDAGLILKENKIESAPVKPPARRPSGTFRYFTEPEVTIPEPQANKNLLHPDLGRLSSPGSPLQIKISDVYHQGESAKTLFSAVYINGAKFLQELVSGTENSPLLFSKYLNENYKPIGNNANLIIIEDLGDRARANLIFPDERKENFYVRKRRSPFNQDLELAQVYDPIDLMPDEVNEDMWDLAWPLGIVALLMGGLFAYSRYNLVALKVTELKSAKLLSDISSQLGVVLNCNDQFIYRTNDKGEFNFVSENSKDVTGYESSELVANKGFKLSESEINRVAQALGELPGLSKSSKPFSIEILNKSGAPLVLEIREQNFLDSETQKKGKIGLAKNITDKILLESNLKETTENKNAILSAFPEGLLVLDQRGAIIEVKDNLENHMDFNKRNELSGNFSILFPKEVREELSSAFDYTILTGQSRTIEFRKNIGKREAILEVQTLKVTANRFVVLVKDITEQKQILDGIAKARNSAQEANLAKNMFLATISHEIRTPLNGIIGLSTLLEESELKPDQLELLSTLKSSANSLNSIVSEILNFSKIESGQVKVERSTFDIQEFTHSIIKEFSTQAQAKGLSLSFDIDQSIPTQIIGDQEKIAQILRHIINNAIKFTESGFVHLNIGLDSIGPLNKLVLKFNVKDSGIGIEEVHITQLFQPFTQVDTTNTRKFGGTGLGLAICQRLVRMMMGEIGVKSIPGRGSEFFFTVQCKSDALSVESTFHRTKLSISKSNLNGNDNDKVQILLIDANPITRLMLEANINKLGYKITANPLSPKVNFIFINVKSPDFVAVHSFLNRPVNVSKVNAAIVGIDFNPNEAPEWTESIPFSYYLSLSNNAEEMKQNIENCVKSLLESI
jgi:signal transduction histidine kinase